MLRFNLSRRYAPVFSFVLLAAYFSILSAYAASPIGVTAALRGDVVRTASFEKAAAIGQMSSGQQVFLGDDIKVGRQGRLQIMLLDETIFTLGANAVMRIDAFVYDPNDASKNNLATSIQKGAFRIVSGQVAKRNANAMTVKLPSATIGVRGTSVAGEVNNDGSAQVILLGPAANNNLGLPAGAINVANEAGIVDMSRPGFITQIATANAPPAPPQQATAAQIRQLEQALSEDAVSELAEGLGVESAEIIVEEGTDSDGDGQLDTYTANEELADAILTATGSDGGVTNDRVILEQVALTLFGADVVNGGGNGGDEFFLGINLGEDIGNLLTGDFEYLGPTLISDLAAFGPTGSVTFTGNNATIQDLNGRDSGSFSLTQIWDFAQQSVSSTISGDFDLAVENNQFITGDFIDTPQVLSFAQAQGVAMVTFSTSFSVDPDTGLMSDAHVFADLGGGDISNNNQPADPMHFREVGAPAMEGMASTEAAGISAFASLDTASEQIFINNSSPTQAYQMQISVGSFISNVDRKDGSSPIASVGEGTVTLDVISYEMGSENTPSEETGLPPTLNSARGTIFAMQRTVSE